MAQHNLLQSFANIRASPLLPMDDKDSPIGPRYDFKGFGQVTELVATCAPLRLCLESPVHSRPDDSPSVRARNNVIILFQLLYMLREFFISEGNERWIWDVVRSEWALDLDSAELTPTAVRFIALAFRLSLNGSIFQAHFEGQHQSGLPHGPTRNRDLGVGDQLLLQLVSKWARFRRSHSADTQRGDDGAPEALRLASRITQWRSKLLRHKDDLLRVQPQAQSEVADHIQGDGLGALCQLLYNRVDNFEAIIGHFINNRITNAPDVGRTVKRLADVGQDDRPYKKHKGQRQGTVLAARGPVIQPGRIPSTAQTDIGRSVWPAQLFGRFDELDARIDELEEKTHKMDRENLEYMLDRFHLADEDIDCTDAQVAALQGNYERLAKELEEVKAWHSHDLAAIHAAQPLVPHDALRDIQSRMDALEADNAGFRRAFRTIETKWLRLVGIINPLVLRAHAADNNREDPGA